VVARKPQSSFLLVPVARRRACQLLGLHSLRLPSFQNRLLNIRREQSDPQQLAGKTAVDAVGFGELTNGALPVLQQPPQPMRPRQRAVPASSGIGIDRVAPPESVPVGLRWEA
jgi:hypothetical protein